MTKTVRVSERTYQRIEARRNEGETTAETLDRLVWDRPLADFAGGLSDDDAKHARETLATADVAAGRESTATLDRLLETETKAGDEGEN